MFFETMIVYLLDGIYIVFGFIPIFDDMYMDGSVIIRVEHEAETEKYKYRWHIFFFCRQIYIILC